MEHISTVLQMVRINAVKDIASHIEEQVGHLLIRVENSEGSQHDLEVVLKEGLGAIHEGAKAIQEWLVV